MLTITQRLVETILEELAVLEKQQSDYEHVRLEIDLAELLKSVWDEQVVGAIRAGIEHMRTSYSGPGAAIAQVLEIFERTLGEEMQRKTEKEVLRMLYAAYRLGRRQVALQVPVGVQFTLEDKNAIEVLSQHQTYWIGSYYHRILSQKIALLAQIALSKGFGRRELEDMLRTEVGEVLAEGYNYWDVLASAVIQRSRAIGAVNSLVAADAKSYRILAMMDERTCPICRRMDGKVFRTAHAVELRDRLMQARTPEQVKNTAPWISSDRQTLDWLDRANADEIAARGMNLPPFHGRCRCTFVIEEFARDRDFPTSYAEIRSRIEGYGRRAAGPDWRASGWYYAPHAWMKRQGMLGFFKPETGTIVIDEDFVKALDEFLANPDSRWSERQHDYFRLALSVLIHEMLHACERGPHDVYRQPWGRALIEGTIECLARELYGDFVKDLGLTRRAGWFNKKPGVWGRKDWVYESFVKVVDKLLNFVTRRDRTRDRKATLYAWALRSSRGRRLDAISGDIVSAAIENAGAFSVDVSELVQLAQEVAPIVKEAFEEAWKDFSAADRMYQRLRRWEKKIQRPH